MRTTVLPLVNHDQSWGAAAGAGRARFLVAVVAPRRALTTVAPATAAASPAPPLRTGDRGAAKASGMISAAGAAAPVAAASGAGGRLGSGQGNPGTRERNLEPGQALLQCRDAHRARNRLSRRSRRCHRAAR